ncbi:MAG TPA: hypothetical protein VGJ05_18895 [Fimbriiglobus sp.]|jgi:hypothetical protein
MRVLEWLPSNKWVALTYLGEEIADAWLEQEGESVSLAFRVPRDRFQLSELQRHLTVENLLTAADVANDEVESWRFGDESPPGPDGTGPGLNEPLPVPLPDADHLTVTVRLKPPAHPEGENEVGGEDVPPEKWQALEALWKTILGIEAGIDSLRLGMDGLRAEMEGAFRKTMGIEEKNNALQADVAQWNKAKTRVHYAVPKVKEFIHRATWSLGTPERKRLGELFKSHIEPRIPFPEMDKAREQLEHLQKDRQVLFAAGNAVNHEGRGILAEIQRAYSTLQRNAADKAKAKRSSAREKGKYF